MIRIPVEPKVSEYLHKKAARSRTPLTGAFELLPLCNMNCRMCYVVLSKEQQEKIGPLHSADDWIKLAEKGKEQGLLYLLLTGGEPFLHPEIRKIIETLHRMGFIITINSNGTMIDEKVMEWLIHSPPVRINMTLYGASDETYARLCRNPKGFTKASHAIKLLREAGIPIRINCSVTPYNKDDAVEIIRFCQEEKLVVAPTAYMFPPARKDEKMFGKNDRFTPEEAAEMQARIEYLMSEKEMFLERIQNQNLSGLVTEPEEDCLEVTGEGSRCRAGRCSFWVTWYGCMTPCGILPAGKPYRNVFEEDFSVCWKTVTEEIEKVMLPAKCAGCHLKDVCRACAAMVYTETGNYHTVPEYRCKMAHAYPQACMDISREISLDTEGNYETEKEC